MIESGHLSHPGLVRTCNEDTWAADPERGLWLVADGMGGFGAGDVASALVRETILAEIRRGNPPLAAIRSADEHVRQLACGHGCAHPPGVSIVLARIHGQRFNLAQVGDCRAFVYQAGSLSDLSADSPDLHTLREHGMIDTIPATPARTATQALGITPAGHQHIHTLGGHWLPGSQLLLCSDGLGEHVDARVIQRILAEPGVSAQECVDWLVATALDGGGADNITALLVREHG